VLHRGFRYELRPTPAQAQTLTEWIGVVRLVYNLAWEQRRDFWRQYRQAAGRSLSWPSQSLEVTALRAEHDWISAVPRPPLEQALRDLDKAFAAFFAGRARYPTPRVRFANDAMRFPAMECSVRRLNAKWSAIRLPKLGWVKFRDTRPMRGRLLSATVSLKAGRWAVSFARAIEHEAASPLATSVGIDRGVVRTLTLSTGEHMQAPNQARLIGRRKRAQRALARCKLGSSRRAAARARVAALSARTARVRTDWCHRASTDIARRFGLVAIEALRVVNMTASGRGKSGLNRSILEQCWGRFATFLEYKLEERGGTLISVPAAYTSQTCASCGVVDARSRESQAVFRCVHCDHTDNADVNAAHEILRRSTAGLGVEGSRRGPVEPSIMAAA
jgi:putative transposase